MPVHESEKMTLANCQSGKKSWLINFKDHVGKQERGSCVCESESEV